MAVGGLCNLFVASYINKVVFTWCHMNTLVLKATPITDSTQFIPT